MTVVNGSLFDIIGAVPEQGRFWFALSRPNWNEATGTIFAPEFEQVIVNVSSGAFTIDLAPTDTMELDAVYYAVLKYRDTASGKEKDYTVGSFAVPTTGGPYQLSDLLVSGPFLPVPEDILATVIASAAAAAAAAVSAQQARADTIAVAASVTDQYLVEASFDGNGVITTIVFPGIYLEEVNFFIEVGGVPQQRNSFTLVTDIVAGTTTVTFAVPFPIGVRVYGRVSKRLVSPIADPSLITMPDGSDALDLFYGARPFASRAAALAAVVSAQVQRISWLAGGNSYAIIRDAAGPIAGADGNWRPDGDLSPDYFIENTVPGTTDTLAGWTAMRDFMASSGLTDVVLRGPYLVSGPIIFNTFRVNITAARGFVGEIIGTHTTGPIIQFRKSFSSSTGVKYVSGGARLASTTHGDLNAAILVGDFNWQNPTDSPGSSGAFCSLIRNDIKYQPGPGILNFGGGVVIEGNTVGAGLDGMLGHGIQVDGGGLIGVPSGDIGHPGWSRISYNRSSRNGGHGIVIGNSIDGVHSVVAGFNLPYRYEVNNNDVGGNATNAAVRFSEHQIYIAGEQVNLDLQVASAVENVGPGIFIAGRQIRVNNTRFVSVTGHAFEVGSVPGFPSKAITIEEFRLNSMGVDLDPAVIVDASLVPSDGIYIRQSEVTAITRLVAKGETGRVTQAIYRDLSIANYPAGVYSLPSENRSNGTAGIFRIETILTAETKQSLRVDFFAATQASGFSARAVTASYILNRNTATWTVQTLFGPTGTALGDLTVSVDVSVADIVTINGVIANASGAGGFFSEIRVQGRNYKVTLL